MSAEVVGTISKIAIRPIKGAGTIEVQSALLTPDGFAGDKDYAIVRAQPDENGVHKFVTQRDRRDKQDRAQGLATLALIQPKLTPEVLQLSWTGRDPIDVARDRSGRDLTVQVWDDVVSAVDQGDEAAEWLSDHLQYDVRLVKAGDSFERPVSQKWHENNNRVRFQDGYPVHWFYQESLDELNRRIEEGGEPAVPWTRFRPNIVAKGAPEPDFEHQIHKGAFGEIPVLEPKPCDRCPVTLVDQDSGQRVSGEPLKTLNTYKRWRRPDKNSISVIFGENALPSGTGEVNVGQEITVVEFRTPPLRYGGSEIKPGRTR